MGRAGTEWISTTSAAMVVAAVPVVVERPLQSDHELTGRGINQLEADHIGGRLRRPRWWHLGDRAPQDLAKGRPSNPVTAAMNS